MPSSPSDHSSGVEPRLQVTEAALPPVTKESEFLSKFLSAPLTSNEIGWMAHYRVIKKVGAGGMGVVLHAEDSHLQRSVALKLMLPEVADHPEARDRFLREARATAKLKSDHVVTIYHVGQERDIPFMAMEFLQGETLNDLLERPEPLTVPQILRIGREIAAGLSAAHEGGLVHRDIKPANIWIEAPSGRVKILDFGLARMTTSELHLTRTGAVLGTVGFMSPEQGRGQAVDARSDLFSLGE